MIKPVEKAYSDFLRAQEIERWESHTPYYSEGSDLLFSVSSVWEFMREASVNRALFLVLMTLKDMFVMMDISHEISINL